MQKLIISQDECISLLALLNGFCPDDYFKDDRKKVIFNAFIGLGSMKHESIQIEIEECEKIRIYKNCPVFVGGMDSGTVNGTKEEIIKLISTLYNADYVGSYCSKTFENLWFSNDVTVYLE